MSENAETAGINFRALGPHLLLPFAIVAVVLIFALLQPAMLSGDNVVNIMKQSSLFFFVACAQLVVIITRGFDLSVGANVSLVSVASSMIMTALVPVLGPGTSIAVGVMAGLLIGASIGAVNGVLVAYGRINPFIVTLATMSIFTGVATTISGGFPIFNLPETFSFALNQMTVLMLPIPLIIAALVAYGLHFSLTRTVHGRVLYVLGDSNEVAHVGGRRVKEHLFLAYITSGVLASVAGLLMTAQTGSGEPNLGTSLVLNSIAAAVIGGASLRGGTGGISAPIYGSLLIVCLSIGMNLQQINGSLQPVVIGAILIFGAALDAYRTKAR
ncbi:ABC transporter permease [Roseovarius sp. Pro17]|uniref:ABC transporter permease n=1 Tax=Roseovarius sp. Pro17 TaxID=3108175 RepID=UPI002D796190|nr:ABC transporter permease [Roseovarius sp. Pro17]